MNVKESLFDLFIHDLRSPLSIAAAGGHNILMVGSPGAGKTMLAQAISSILPKMTLDEAIAATQVWSAAGMLKGKSLISTRPFRSPHHTASPVSVVGGGADPKPGEMSLAHLGVLFLDELPEFRRDLLESLRQPLESGKVFISRARGHLEFPARFMLVSAMNPCPCGYYRDEEKECRCGAHEVMRYQKKVSGPLLDRIDIQINVPKVKAESLMQAAPEDDTETQNARVQVEAARGLQRERYSKFKSDSRPSTNAELSSKQCDRLIALAPGAKTTLGKFAEKGMLSARGYYRVLKVARTIADLEGADTVTQEHLSEAFNYRLKQED